MENNNLPSDGIDDGRKTCPFDHHSKAYADDHRKFFPELRERGPIVWSEAYGGFWITTDYEQSQRVLEDSETFRTEVVGDSLEGGTLIPTPPKAPWLSPTNTLFNFNDGQRHDIVRDALKPHFSKRRVMQLNGIIEARVDEAFDRVLKLSEFDIVFDLASPVVAGIVNDLMGFDLEDPSTIFRAIAAQSHDKKPADSGTDAVEPAIRSFRQGWDYLGEVIRARRSDPRDDVISAVIQANDGQFSDHEIQGMCTNIIFGAADTAAALAAHSISFLADRPDLRSELREDPRRMPAFVREGLRYFNVAMGVARTAAHDIEIGGAQMRRGDRVLALLPSANLDPKRYDHPEDFDHERVSAQHLGFGYGSHACLGASLAQALVAALITGLLDRVESYSIPVDNLVRNPDMSFINLFLKAPMRVDSLRMLD